MRLTLILGFSLLAAACAPKSETPAAAGAPTALSAADIDAVKAVDAAFAAGVNAKDTAAVYAVYAPDAQFMPPDAPIMDATGMRGEIAGLIAGGAGNFVMNPTTVNGVGDLAYIVGTANFTMGGAPATVKYAEVLRKGADGKWRYVVDMFSGVAPAAPAPK
jgi:ketosteroid isomerase-like protein